MHRPFVIKRSGEVAVRADGNVFAVLHQVNGDEGNVRGMYFVDLAPGLGGDFRALTSEDLERGSSAVVPDATPVNPYFPNSSPRLYFKTQENAARCAYDVYMSLR